RAIELSCGRAGQVLRVGVADRGPGIAPDQLEQVFAPFFTTKRDGLGLGLNICRTIVEAHGGCIDVENRAGGGAIFTFTLPTES
ncbi:MAG TPA: PAS domain-containing sensor histidine kinase, partial [Massilia sp.]|nr:PAS domain-containing sensor histidine kinase [Massilia sp.]